MGEWRNARVVDLTKKLLHRIFYSVCFIAGVLPVSSLVFNSPISVTPELNFPFFLFQCPPFYRTTWDLCQCRNSRSVSTARYTSTNTVKYQPSSKPPHIFMKNIKLSPVSLCRDKHWILNILQITPLVPPYCLSFCAPCALAWWISCESSVTRSPALQYTLHVTTNKYFV